MASTNHKFPNRVVFKIIKSNGDVTYKAGDFGASDPLGIKQVISNDA